MIGIIGMLRRGVPLFPVKDRDISDHLHQLCAGIERDFFGEGVFLLLEVGEPDFEKFAPGEFLIDGFQKRGGKAAMPDLQDRFQELGFAAQDAAFGGRERRGKRRHAGMEPSEPILASPARRKRWKDQPGSLSPASLRFATRRNPTAATSPINPPR